MAVVPKIQRHLHVRASSSSSSSSSSAGPSKDVIAGISVVASAIFIATLVIIWLLVKACIKRKRNAWVPRQIGSQSKLSLAEMTTANPEISKPRRILTRSQFLPYGSDTAWKSLASRETMDQPSMPFHGSSRLSQDVVHDRRQPTRRSLQKKWKFSAMPAKDKRSFRLSKISEKESQAEKKPSASHRTSQVLASADDVMSSFNDNDDNRLVNSAIQKTSSVPDFTPVITSEDVENLAPGPLFANDRERTGRTTRSKSIGSGPGTSPQKYSLGSSSGGGNRKVTRLPMHARSISLGGHQPCPAPNVPVPPLPLIHTIDRAKSAAKCMIEHSPSRYSNSSAESVGSSLLAYRDSPQLLRRYEAQRQLSTEKLWQQQSNFWNRRPQMPDRQSSFGKYQRPSALNSKRHLSDGGSLERANTIASLQGGVRLKQHLSASDIIAAHRASSNPNPAQQNAEYIPHVNSTPKRYSQSRTTIYGSPCERRKTPASRIASQVAITPIRNPSLSSFHASSTRSSNGNPFQWDPSPLQSGKPSALKGSPSARKGHRRQSYVRIVIEPTILGPQSQSPSQSIMNDIREESSEQETIDSLPNYEASPELQRRCLPRPPSISNFDPKVNRNVKSMEASLVDDSPTLSLTELRDDLRTTGSKRTPLSEIPSPQLPRSPESRNSTFFSIPDFPDPASNPSDAELPPMGSFSSFYSVGENDENTPPSMKLERMLSIGMSNLPSESFDDHKRVTSPDSLQETSTYFDSVTSPTSEINSNNTAEITSAAEYLMALKQSSKIPRSGLQLSPPQNQQTNSDHRNHKSSRAPCCQTSCRSELHNIVMKATPRIPPPQSSSINGPRSAPPLSVQKSIDTLRRMDSDISTILSITQQQITQVGGEVSPSIYQSDSEDHNDDWGDFQSAGRPSSKESVLKEAEERSSRIWEEGEKFWSGSNSHTGGTRLSFKTPDVKVLPPSTQVTPASLYDVDGFLMA